MKASALATRKYQSHIVESGHIGSKDLGSEFLLARVLGGQSSRPVLSNLRAPMDNSVRTSMCYRSLLRLKKPLTINWLTDC